MSDTNEPQPPQPDAVAVPDAAEESEPVSTQPAEDTATAEAVDEPAPAPAPATAATEPTGDKGVLTAAGDGVSIGAGIRVQKVDISVCAGPPAKVRSITKP